jgi:hypothetical protein
MSIHVRPESIANDVFERVFAGQGRPFTYNKTIAGSWYRPDFFFSAPGIAVVAECDEDGHRSYNPSDEIYREHKIARCLADLGYDEIYILRFDPRVDHGARHTRASVRHLETVAHTIGSILKGERPPHGTVDTRRRLFTKITM